MKKKIIKFLLFITQIPVSALIAPQVVLSDAAFKQHLLCPHQLCPAHSLLLRLMKGGKAPCFLFKAKKLLEARDWGDDSHGAGAGGSHVEGLCAGS